MVSAHHQQHPDIIVIHENHNFTIHAYEVDMEVHVDRGDDRPIKRQASFKVVKDMLINLKPLPKQPTFWQGLFRGHLEDSRKPHTETKSPIGCTSLKAFEILLRVAHSTIDDIDDTVPISEMWHLAELCHFFGTDHSVLYDWYGTWWERNNDIETLEEHQEFLFPAWYFNHAKAFLTSTRYVVYNMSGHIQERNAAVPVQDEDFWERDSYGLERWHLPQRLIQQLNSARGRQRTNLWTYLKKPVPDKPPKGCKCGAETHCDYLRALDATGATPLEENFQKLTVNEILRRLNKFAYTADPTACFKCRSHDFEAKVKRAHDIVTSYFHGLCIDCMEKTKTSTKSYDADYWSHLKVSWDDGCRAKHGQSSWYHSFCGRNTDKQGIAEQMRARMK